MKHYKTSYIKAETLICERILIEYNDILLGVIYLYLYIFILKIEFLYYFDVLVADVYTVLM